MTEFPPEDIAKDGEPYNIALITKQRQLRTDADVAHRAGDHLRSLELFEEARHLGGRICRALSEHHVMEIRTKWGASHRCQRCGRRLAADGRAMP